MAEAPRTWQMWIPTPAERSSRILLEGRSNDGATVGQDPVKPSTASTIPLSLAESSSPTHLGPATAALPQMAGGVPRTSRGCGEIGRGSGARRLARSFNELDVQGRGQDDDVDEDFNDNFIRSYNRQFSQSYGDYDSDEDWGKDLTACDKECGYCGRCMY